MKRYSQLSVRIMLALLLFTLLLGAVTLQQIMTGFEQTRQQVVHSGADTLWAVGERQLQEIARYEAGIINRRLHEAAATTRTAADYLARVAQGDSPPISLADLTWDANGNGYDTSPSRLTDVWVPNYLPPSDRLRDDLAFSSLMDPLFPALMAQADDITALYFQSDELMLRYYPPVGLYEKLINSQAVDPAMAAAYVDTSAPPQNPERDTVWDPPYVDMAGQGVIVTVASPVYVGDDYRGFIGADVRLNHWVEHMDTLHPTPSGYGVLLDEFGRVVASPERATPHFPIVEPLLFETEADYIPLRERPNTVFPYSFLEELDLSHPGSISQTVNGDALLIGYAPLPDIGWTLLTVAHVDELTAETQTLAGDIQRAADDTVNGLLLTVSGFFLGGLLITGYSSRRWLIRPIQALVNATERVAGGDLSVTLPTNRRDELGTLATAFNQMAVDLRASQDELERRVRDRTRELSVLYDVTAVASASLDSDTILKNTLARVTEAVNSTCVTIHRLESPSLTLAAYHGDPPASFDGTDQARIVAKTKRPRVVADLSAENPTLPALTYVGVPMQSKGSVMGVLCVLRPADQPYSVTEVALLASVGDQIGIAMENADLLRQSEALAVVQERQRLARDLHDAVTQSVYSVTLMAEAARRAARNEQWETVVNLVGRLQEIGGQALKEMRLLVYELRPLALKQEGLVGAVRHRLDAVERRAGLDVTLEADSVLTLPEALETDLYRIIQESLNNALKHAEASTMAVRIQQEDESLLLTICDNGRGFDLSEVAESGGMGLHSLRERAARLGGTLHIDTSPNNGTTITLRI